MWLVGKTTLKPSGKGDGCKDSIQIYETLADAQAKYQEALCEKFNYAAWLCPIFDSTDHGLPKELHHLSRHINCLMSGEPQPFELKEDYDSVGFNLTVSTPGGIEVTIGQNPLNPEAASINVRTAEQRARGLAAVELFYTKQHIMKIGYDLNPSAYAVRQIYSFKDAA